MGFREGTLISKGHKKGTAGGTFLSEPAASVQAVPPWQAPGAGQIASAKHEGPSRCFVKGVWV